MKKLGVFIIILSVVFMSCNKRRQVDIEGRVYNPVTQEGIAGAELWLLKSGPITEFYGGYERVETVYSDANGNFKVNVKSAKAEILRLGDMHGEYYNIGWYKNGSKLPSDLPVEQGKNMKADFYAVPYGEIKTSVHNINCSGPTDTLIFKRIYQHDPNNSVFQPFTFTGCYDNDGAFAKVPSGDYKLEWTVIRSGVSNTYSHILSVPGNGQAYYNIDY